jgi:iron complex outermembrane receptor protein
MNLCCSVAGQSVHNASLRRHLPIVCMIVLLCVIGYPALSQKDEGPPSVSALKKLSLDELANVEVVSVSKRPEKLSQVPSAIQIITSDDIKNSGATTVPEALRLVPNLQVAQVNASQWSISARGFNNVLANKLLVLIDGRVVYTPMYAGVFWDVQNLLLEDIDRIEVISGPGGTLWGANAVNGVINIITKGADKTQGLYAEAAAGTELRGLGSLRYGGKVGENLSYRIYGTGFKRDNTIFRKGNDSTANDSWGIAQGGVRVDWDPKESDHVTFQSNLYDGRPDPDGGHPVIAKGGNALGRWKHTISEKSSFQMQAYYDHTFRDFQNGFAEKLSTYDLEGQHLFQAGKGQQIIYGFGFRFMDHDVTNLELFGFLPARKSLYLYNAFIQDEISLIAQRLYFTLGTKVEHSTYAGFQYQPNARLTWKAGNHHTIWGAVSRAVRLPSRIDREFHVDVAPGVSLITSSDFKPEEVIAYELGWRVQPQNSLSMSVSTFYNVYNDLRSVEPGPAPIGIPLTFGNGVKGNTYGAELASTYQPLSWWHLRAGCTFLKKDLKIKANSQDRNKGTAESNDPSHQFLLQSSVDLPHALGFGTVLRYISKLSQPYVSDYIGLDVRLSWKVNKIIELSMVGQNLVKKSHTEFVPTSPAAKNIERSVYGKIACRF